jgi:hypothetical protein
MGRPQMEERTGANGNSVDLIRPSLIPDANKDHLILSRTPITHSPRKSSNSVSALKSGS